MGVTLKQPITQAAFSTDLHSDEHLNQSPSVRDHTYAINMLTLNIRSTYKEPNVVQLQKF